jgi:hypothetical protein
MVDPSQQSGDMAFPNIARDSNVLFTLSLKRFGSLLWQGDLTAARDGCSGVSRKLHASAAIPASRPGSPALLPVLPHRPRASMVGIGEGD